MNRHPSIRDSLNELIVRELHLAQGLSEGDLASQLDSIQRLSLVVAIEDHFKICFEPEEEDSIETLDEVIALIAAKLDG